ncbi:hypothetical protein GCM10022243_20360 [Saccharothrix violaceirubra]
MEPEAGPAVDRDGDWIDAVMRGSLVREAGRGIGPESETRGRTAVRYGIPK